MIMAITRAVMNPRYISDPFDSPVKTLENLFSMFFHGLIIACGFNNGTLKKSRPSIDADKVGWKFF